jgi:hypothetical protein
MTQDMPKRVEAIPSDDAAVTPIIKPSGFSLNQFKSKRAAIIGGVGAELGALPHYPQSHAKDYTKLHPNEEKYWSDELCFVSIPIKGEKSNTLHIIDEELAMRHLPSGRILRFRLALATKPFDIFFLCHVPSQNLDNSWNKSNLNGCEKARTLWIQATSRKKEGVEEYKLDPAQDQDAFPEPDWPICSLDEIIFKAFAPHHMITSGDHPGLLRLLGAKQNLS